MKRADRNKPGVLGKEHYNRRLKASPIGERARRILDALRHKKHTDGNDSGARKRSE